MKHIPFLLARTDSVKETIATSKQVFKECDFTFSFIISLPISKIENHAQNKNSNDFKDCFIAFRAFHIKLSILSTFGKLIGGSKSPCLLIECQIIASRSIY